MNHNLKNYIFWKWSNNGEPFERSLRKKVCIDDDLSKQQYHIEQLDDMDDQHRENMAYTQSMQCDSTNWSESNDIMFLEHQFKLASNNTREESYNKMAEREMISQTRLNPFLQQTTNAGDNYIQDVINRDLFMKPVNTNIEKPDSENSNIILE